MSENETSLMPGGWFVNVITENFSENVKLAFAKLNYANHSSFEPIAQIATQVVAGLNYVVLAEQKIYGNPAIKLYVRIVFYAKPYAKEPSDIEITSMNPLPLGCTSVAIPDGQRVDVSDIIRDYEKRQQTDNQTILGGWEKDTLVKDWPKVVDNAIDLLNKNFGASYKAIAYLGKQVVKGINYAVLAEQTIICRQDAKNIVLIIFNVFEDKITITSIEILLEGRSKAIPGGIVIEATTDIPTEVQKEFDSVMKHFVGANVKPFASLGYQVVSGINRFLAVETTPLYPKAKTKISLLTINAMENTAKFVDIL